MACGQEKSQQANLSEAMPSINLTMRNLPMRSLPSKDLTTKSLLMKEETFIFLHHSFPHDISSNLQSSSPHHASEDHYGRVTKRSQHQPHL